MLFQVISIVEQILLSLYILKDNVYKLSIVYEIELNLVDWV